MIAVLGCGSFDAGVQSSSITFRVHSLETLEIFERILLLVVLSSPATADETVENVMRKITKGESIYEIEMAKIQNDVVKWLDTR